MSKRWNYEEIRDAHFKVLLEEGKLDDKLTEIFEDFWTLSPFKQYELISYIKKHGKRPEWKVLKKVLGLSEDDTHKFLIGDPIEVKFPVVDLTGGPGKIVRGIAVKGLSKVVTNVGKEKHQRLKKIVGSGFAVFYDTEFTGKSFQLPLAVSLMSERIPEGVLFTGELSQDGRILRANHIEEKKKIAAREGYILVDPAKLPKPDLKSLLNWLNKDIHHIPMLITSSEKHQDELKDFTRNLQIEDLNLELAYLETFGIEPVLWTGQIKDQRWQEVCKEFYSRLKHIGSVLGGFHLHIAIRGPAALAFALGILHGSFKPFTIYHFQNNAYRPIVVDNVRYIKERLSGNPRLINYTVTGSGEEVAVVINLAHHSVQLNSLPLTNATYLVIETQGGGNLPVENFKDIAREIAGAIQEVAKTATIKRFHFFFSCPVPIAFLVGVAFGHYNPGSIYNYEQGTYKKVLDIEFLRDLRES
ncbi:SAVED domain-containing protein [Thermocrinis minervae]|uniref:SMODS-associated and fused to various effectors domain-containing protein n=1 Tax=Thermocrinis minervae TaxID=381751 RepID=A0A1M6Q5V1_9AQUI|nr:SAVED domain-containing protein [Thermocrinis minervae]SHK15555.1 hypothetical protein SAMN05444391_0088 [Thermocrinis minervae]